MSLHSNFELFQCHPKVRQAPSHIDHSNIEYVQPVRVVPDGPPIPAVSVHKKQDFGNSYDAPIDSYGAPKPSYGAPAPSYNPPKSSYGPPKPIYNAKPTYDAPQSSYGVPVSNYNSPVYIPSSSGYDAPVVSRYLKNYVLQNLKSPN